MNKQLTIFDCGLDSNFVSEPQIKGISLWQPWASLISFGLKQYETRSWGTSYRGKLVICSAQKTSRQQRQDYSNFADKHGVDRDWSSLPFGCAIVLCDLIDCTKMTDNFIQRISTTELDCGDWKVGRYAWKLDQIKVLDNPIATKGKQRLWNIEPNMNEQLAIFDSVGDSKNVSSTSFVEDGKIQAIQRFLCKAEAEAEAEPTASISKYSPNGRRAKYYRLVYRQGKKVNAVHIKGGNCSARLSTYRAQKLQELIDRGAELREVLEQLADFNGGTSKASQN